MGARLLPCCYTYTEKESQPTNSDATLHHSYPSSTSSSLSSLPSLPSVPSLIPSSNSQDLTTTSATTTPTSHNLVATLKGHSSPISSLALAGKTLLAGAADGEIRSWNPQNPTSNNSVVATGTGAVKSLVVLKDGMVFTAHQDHKIRAWKMEYNNISINDDENSVIPVLRQLTCLAVLPTLNDRLSNLFSARNYVQVRRHKKCTWVHHVDAVSTLAASHDGSLLYSASWDRSFKVWSTASSSGFKCLESVSRAHDDAINAIAVSRDGVVYTGSADRKIKAWRRLSGEKKSKHSLVGVMEKHKSAVNALAVSDDGSMLYSGACDRSILVWRKQNRGGNSKNNGGELVLLGALRGHTKAVLCLVVLEDVVFSGSADNTVRIWRKRVDDSYSCLSVLEGHKRPVKCLVATTDCRGTLTKCGRSQSSSSRSYLVYSGSLDWEIKVWQVNIP